MRAAVCRAFGAPLSIEEVTLAPPRRGEVRCAVRVVAICQSDVTYLDGGWGGALPAVYGHEAAGVVLETGPGVAGLHPGQRVLISMVRHCGACPCCAAGLPGSCEGRFALDAESRLTGADGGRIEQGLRTGAFAEEVVVDASQLAPIPDDLAFDVACLLACGVITGFGAVTRTAAVPPGADVAVIGTGGVGLNAVQGARHAGARRIVGIDLSAERLEAARAFGATDTIRGAGEDAVAALLALTGGRGVDYAFVTVGAPSACDQSYAMLAPGGMSVLVGVAKSGASSAFDPIALVGRSQRIAGSKLGGDMIRAIPELVGLYRAGTLALDALITARFPFERIDAAIDTTRRGEGLRSVVVIGEDSP